MTHELALQKALLAHLKADTGITALLGDRLWDVPPAGAGYPLLQIGRCESRPVNADGGGVEHLVTLMIISSFQGGEEAKAAMSAVRARLADVMPETDGVRVVSIGVRFSDVWRSPTGPRTYALLRVRAVTEEI
ncbi:DUF3168 domain-containing protein [Brevundimonas sp. FT23042]|uniref:DUF3168 domain-containing protein n=1 Tax=Brevundimonas sp. FT23042 TaxID=3393749 RepID=UPI003B588B36